jgi:hypothetical protein
MDGIREESAVKDKEQRIKLTADEQQQLNREPVLATKHTVEIHDSWQADSVRFGRRL